MHEWLTGRPAGEFRGDWRVGFGYIQERGNPIDAELRYRGGDLYEGRTRGFYLDGDRGPEHIPPYSQPHQQDRNYETAERCHHKRQATQHIADDRYAQKESTCDKKENGQDHQRQRNTGRQRQAAPEIPSRKFIALSQCQALILCKL